MITFLIWVVTLLPVGDGQYALKGYELLQKVEMENYEVCMEYANEFNEEASRYEPVQNEDGTVSVAVATCEADL